MSLQTEYPFRLPKGVVDEIERYYAPSNRRLAELRDLPLGDLGYPMKGDQAG